MNVIYSIPKFYQCIIFPRYIKLFTMTLLVVYGDENDHRVFTYQTKHLLFLPCCFCKHRSADRTCLTVLSTFSVKKKNLWKLQPNFSDRSIFVTLFERPHPGLGEHRLTAMGNCWHFTVLLFHI